MKEHQDYKINKRQKKLSHSQFLIHYGTPRHSGRYPWGSGKDPYQSSNKNTISKNDEKTMKEELLDPFFYVMKSDGSFGEFSPLINMDEWKHAVRNNILIKK